MKRIHISVFLLTDDHWEFVGHTIVTNNYVRLTSDVRSSQGAIWNTAVSVFMSEVVSHRCYCHSDSAGLGGGGC